MAVPDETALTDQIALSKDLSARAAVVWLTAIATVSIAARAGFAQLIHAPFVFMDELGYSRSALSLAQTGHVELFGKPGLAYSPLYSAVLSPVYALVSSPAEAYAWAKVVNAVLMSLAVFPVYGIARFLLSRKASLAVAGLSALAPLMFYTALEMAESLAYPLFLVATWAMLRALQNPRPRNDALLLGAIVLACSARLQVAALVPTAVTAPLAVALVRSGPGDLAQRLRSTGRSLARHWLLLGSLALGLAAVIARTIANSGEIPLAGRYSIVGNAHASVLNVVEIAFHHFAELDLAVGVVPFAAALLAGYALVHDRFPQRALVFATVAVSATFWLLLEVAFDAAAFDRGNPASQSTSLTAGDLPRIHERYLIYLVPLFLVTLIAVTRRARSRIPARITVAAAVAAAVLPAAIPFKTVINYTIVPDSFALQMFGAVQHGLIVPVAHPTALALVMATIAAATFLLAFAGPYRGLAVGVTVAELLFMSFLVAGRFVSTTPAGLPAHRDWVDRANGRAETVAIGGAGAKRLGLLETTFFNRSVARVYYTCEMAFGVDFGETRAALDGAGRLVDASGRPIRARYAVVPARFGIRGRVRARDPKGGLVLVAPAGEYLRVRPTARAAASCGS